MLLNECNIVKNSVFSITFWLLQFIEPESYNTQGNLLILKWTLIIFLCKRSKRVCIYSVRKIGFSEDCILPPRARESGLVTRLIDLYFWSHHPGRHWSHHQMAQAQQNYLFSSTIFQEPCATVLSVHSTIENVSFPSIIDSPLLRWAVQIRRRRGFFPSLFSNWELPKSSLFFFFFFFRTLVV